LNTNDILTTNSQPQPQPPELEHFLVDSDIDPELVLLLRKLGFKATHATWHPDIPNDDTRYLIWGREHGYILLCHDKHRDAKTRYTFYSEMYYHGGQVIRVGKPGQPNLRLLGCILAQRHQWQEFFSKDSGEASVHPSGCNVNSASKLLERSKYELRLPFDDPAIPLKTRKPSTKTKGPRQKLNPTNQFGPFPDM
jgi:hypothetical protein